MVLRNTFYFVLFTLCIHLVGCTNEQIKEEGQSENELVDTLREISPDSIQSKGLLSVKEVQALLQQDTTVVLIEVSKPAKYAAGHLPHATSTWRPDYGSKSGYEYGGMRASKLEMEAFLSQRGILPTDNIILYDTKGNCDALRLAWLLWMYGHENTQIINGGKAAWEKANFPLTKIAPPLPKPTNYKFSGKEDTSAIATLEEIKEAIQDTNIVIVDTREPAEFLGQPYISKGQFYPFKKGAYTYGCIPSAVHLNWSDAVNLKGDHRFKCLKDLKHNFTEAGITPDKEIIVYCQSGVRSLHTYYVLTEILGYPNVKNYDGSWIEWSYNYVKNDKTTIQRHTSEEEYTKLQLALEETLNK